jgi:hypothetical protein
MPYKRDNVKNEKQYEAQPARAETATARKPWRATASSAEAREAHVPVSSNDDATTHMRSANDKHNVCRLHCVVFG